MADLIGQRIGQYEIVSLLGEGGMAAVYLARQTNIKREVAIKVIDTKLARMSDFIRRFEREAETIAKLDHPHILKLYDYGEQGEIVYLVMQLLRGGSLAQRIQQGAMSLEETARVIDQIASALDYSHRKGVIHRDLKPQNVLFDEEGNAFLSDFGIAKLSNETALTQSGTAMGTPSYMSPEQCQSLPLDSRTDIYAMGIMLFEMLTGVLPFSGETPLSVLYQHLSAPPPSLKNFGANFPAQVQDVIHKALAKNRDDRFASAGELAKAFHQAISGSYVPQQPKPSPELPATAVGIKTQPQQFEPTARIDIPTTPQKRNLTPVIAIGVAAVVILGIVLFILSKLGSPASVSSAPTATTVSTQPIIVTLPPASSTSTRPPVTAIATGTTAPNAETLAAIAIASYTKTPTLDAQLTVQAMLNMTTTAMAIAASQTKPVTPTFTATAPPTSTPTEAVTNTEQPTISQATQTPMPTAAPRILSGHAAGVNSVAFSPDGKFLVSGSSDKTAILWDVTSGQQVRTFTGHADIVWSVAFSPDGKMILTGSGDKTAKLWDVETGKVIRTFTGHTDAINGVSFSPDGKSVLTASGDKTAKVWDAATGKLIRSLSGDSDVVNSAVFSPDGKFILTASYDKQTILWDASTGQQVHVFSGHSDSINMAVFSPDGKQILTGSWDKTAILWDASTAKQIRTFSGHSDRIFSVAFSADGQSVLTGSADLTAKLWDTNTDSVIQTFTGHTSAVLSVGFSPDGKWIATASDDATIRLWPYSP